MKTFTAFVLISLFIYSCTEEKTVSETLETDETQVSSYDLSAIVDSLLFGSSIPDTIDYDGRLEKNRKEFLVELVKKIDVDRKINLYSTEPSTEYMSSNKMVQTYVGVRSICLLNKIIQAPTFQIKSTDDVVCRHCHGSALQKDRSDVDLKKLQKFKRLCMDWLKETDGILSEESTKLWNDKFWNKINSELIKNWN